MEAITEKQEELPEITRLDEEAQQFLAVRRACLRPHKHGWWRNMPNPHAVGDQVSDDEL
jgi:hypothetical protein